MTLARLVGVWSGAALLVGCAHRLELVTPPLAPTAPTVSRAVPVAVGPPPRVLRILRPRGEASIPVFSVEVDLARVYFNDGAGRLWSAPKDGSAEAVVLVDDPRDSVRSFIVDGSTIYYAARQEIRSVPTSGGASMRWASNSAGPILLVSDGRYIYHTVFDGSGTFRLSLATRREERFCRGGKHQTLAVDGENLYSASYFAGTISAISKSTRRVRVLASGVRRPVRLLVDDRYVYFTSEADGTLRRVRKRGGRVEVLARGQRGQEHLAIDRSHVYWATRTAPGVHAVMRAPLVAVPRPPAEQLYVGLSSASGLAVDDRFVYVADRGAGEIVRVSKEPK